MKLKILFSCILLVIAFVVSCKKDSEPENPYDDVNYDTDTSSTSNPDPTSIVGLHKNIFFTKCAKSGCHDGTFEPDFRTVQSSYSTLVYQRVNKFTVNGVDSFEFRVIPFDTTSSFIHERITTTTSDYMPSNGNRLSQTEIQQINAWIMNGAKNQYGQVAVAPNLPPVITGMVAIDADSALNLVYYPVDTNRLNDIAYNPFIIHPNQNIYIIFGVEDDSTSYANLSDNQLKWSYNQDDFSSASTINAQFLFNYWLVSVSANAFTPNDTVFFRYYVNDGDHTSPTEFPRNDYPFYYKWYCSFIVQ